MSRHLRILVVQQDYPPVTNGYAVMCAQACTWLQESGHDLLVLTTHQLRPGTTITAYGAEGKVRVRRVLRSYWDRSTGLAPPLLEAFSIERANQAHLRKAIADHRPDVVSFWHMGGLSLGMITFTARLGMPITFIVGDDWLVYGPWVDRWLRRFTHHPWQAALIERLTGLPTRLPDLGSIGTFCFVSDFTRRRAEQKRGWHFQRFEVIYPGISHEQFPPITSPFKRQWLGRLLWMGRVVEDKGIVTAIKSLALLPEETALEIVGPVDPDFQHALQTLAIACGRERQLSFSLASRQEVRARYQYADVTLFTSSIEHEAFGLVPLEAMASGCPVIATGVGGSSEFCRDGINCLLVPPQDPSALASAVRRLAANPGLRRQLVEGGLRTAAEFPLDQQAQRIEQVFLAALAARKGKTLWDSGDQLDRL
jgi:glycogen synthase